MKQIYLNLIWEGPLSSAWRSNALNWLNLAPLVATRPPPQGPHTHTSHPLQIPPPPTLPLTPLSSPCHPSLPHASSPPLIASHPLLPPLQRPMGATVSLGLDHGKGFWDDKTQLGTTSQSSCFNVLHVINTPGINIQHIFSI